MFLVEDHENVERLERHAADLGVKHCTILSWDDYVRSPLKVDVVLICCVIHTVPSVQLRRTIIEVNREKLRPNRPLFIVSPKHDSKYRPTVLKGVQRFRDGIVRLYEETRTFSFYRNYTRLEIETFVDRAGLTIVKRIRSRDRYVYMALPSAP